jgi:Caspase domain/WD domain, G-beta repeat
MPCGFRLLAALGIWLAAGAAFPAEAGPSREETLTLQKRLTDAGCYQGAIDGAPSAALDTAVKACPDQRPVLRIETGMHTATIWRIGVDAACRRASTGSDDKTVRLWSLPDGKLERIIRLPIGPGNGGKVFAIDLSPDGRRLAAGGWDASSAKLGSHSLSLVDLDSGSIRRVGILPNVIFSLAFSADGARVAVGLGRNNGIRVYDWTSGQELLADRDYADDVYGLAFAPDGSLVASSRDGQLRRYGPDLRRTAKRGGLAGKQPYGVAVDPAGRRLAVGFVDTAKVSILDAVTLAPIADADVGGVTNGDLSKVAWSRDVGTFAAGGRAAAQREGAWRRFLRAFDPSGQRRGPDIPVSASTVMDLRPCGDGFAFAAGDPAFGLVSPGGATETLQGPRTADMRDKLGTALEISGDGASVRFGLGDREEKPVLFDLAAGSLADAPRAPAGLAPARIDGLPVTDWENSFEPKFKGVKIGLDNYERARSLAVRPDGSGFALGTEWQVRAFDATGKPTWQQPGPGMAWGVDYSADGQILVVAYGDGTIRWLRGLDGQELLAFFVEPPTRKWVAWTPTGYYMASAGGEDLIGWHINRGWTQLADFYSASRFSDRFNRPDIVKLVLKTRDESEAVRQADEAARRKTDTASVAAKLPPVVTIRAPKPEATFDGETIDIDFDVRSPSGLAVDRVDAQIDGRPVEARGVTPASASGERHLTLPAPPHDVEVSILARSGDLVGEAASVRLKYAGRKADEAEPIKPKLYAVVIGVSDYVEPGLRLSYAAADARGVAEALQRQKGGLYRDVEVRPLVDRDATRLAVIDALEWLDAQVTSRDVGVVMIAGHGYTDEKGAYWFLPADAQMAHLGGTSVSQFDLRRAFAAIAGKAIVFLDTCHANAEKTAPDPTRDVRGLGPGGVDVIRFANDLAKAENGLVTFASTQGTELAAERPEWGHGAFSLALIEGLSGKADLLHKSAITVSALDYYIAERVKELTNGAQHPVMSRPDTVPDFAFATTR